MNREIYRICLGMPENKIAKAMDVISAALVAQYHKNVMVIQEGHASDAAIDAIPPSVSVFIICAENHHEIKFETATNVVHLGEIIDEGVMPKEVQ